MTDKRLREMKEFFRPENFIGSVPEHIHFGYIIQVEELKRKNAALRKQLREIKAAVTAPAPPPTTADPDAWKDYLLGALDGGDQVCDPKHAKFYDELSRLAELAELAAGDTPTPTTRTE